MLEGLDLGQIQGRTGAGTDYPATEPDRAPECRPERGASRENQRLRDEIARLKGEKGKPQVKPNACSGNRNYSSVKRTEKAASPQLRVQHAQTGMAADGSRSNLKIVDPALRPEEAQFKGCEDVFVQELIFRTDNVLYHKEKFYSPWQQKTFLAELPPGYQGQFGPPLKAFIWVLYFAAQVSEPKSVELLFRAGIRISGAEVSNLLIQEQEPLHQEKAEIVQAWRVPPGNRWMTRGRGSTG